MRLRRLTAAHPAAFLTLGLLALVAGCTNTADEDAPAASPSAASVDLVPRPDTEPVTLATTLGDVEFRAYGAGPGSRLVHPVTTPHGYAALRGGRVLSSTDGLTWQELTFSISPDGLTTDGEDLVLHTSGHDSTAVRATWDGDGWTEAAAFPVPEGTQALVYGPAGAIAVVGTRYFWAADGVAFAPATTEPGRDRTRYNAPRRAHHLATAAGFVALLPAAIPEGSGLPVSVPGSAAWQTEVWTSRDGSTWERAPTTFGAGAQVGAVASHDGTFVAVGSTSPVDNAWRTEEPDPGGGVWLSDDGVTWERVAVPGMGSFWAAVAGGELGWVVTSYPDQAWFSPDGRAWDGPEIAPPGLHSGWGPGELVVGEAIFGSGADLVLALGRTAD